MIKLNEKEKKQLQYVGLIVLGLLGYRYFTNKTDNTGATYDPTGNGNNASAGNGGTFIPVFNAKNVANQLWEAMKSMGTDEDAIFETLKYVNLQQFVEVIKFFGKKPYNKITGNNYFLILQTPTYYDLPTILKNELSDQNYNTLRLKYKGLL